ncbi:RNA polymerase sigma-70 factor [Pedobacter heparinus]|uniref:RNA polymerase sigma-70 factor n=1 Tax=Pedobacter heparinus TaxID=984 RepID=UPI002930DC38|nr:RNA polymerase sigma-70 factor [Pedobacter heparinus]
MAAYSTYTDQELTPLLREGDAAAFESLYQRYWKKLLHFANQKTGDFMEAENIVQDVFVSLWNRRENLSINSGLENYLIVSVKYRVIKLFDRQRSQRLYQEQNMAAVDLLDDSTQQYLDFDELRHRLEELIGKLPEKSALIYRMNKEEGKSHKKIAAEMGMSEKAVNSQLVRTKKILREGLHSLLLLYLL